MSTGQKRSAASTPPDFATPAKRQAPAASSGNEQVPVKAPTLPPATGSARATTATPPPKPQWQEDKKKVRASMICACVCASTCAHTSVLEM